MPQHYDAGNAIRSGSPFGQQQPLGQAGPPPAPVPPQGGTKQAVPGIEQMMNDPGFQQYIQAAQQRNKKTSITDLLEGRGTLEELAQAFPKLQKYQEAKKLEEAKKKVQDIKEEQLFKRSQIAYDAQQNQGAPQGSAA